MYRDPLMFACEDKLDRLIQTEPLLYQAYKEVLSHLLRDTLTPERFKETLDSVREEVDRIESETPIRNYLSRKVKRKQYVETLYKTFMARRNKLQAILVVEPG